LVELEKDRRYGCGTSGILQQQDGEISLFLSSSPSITGEFGQPEPEIKQVKKFRVEKKVNEIINRLEKTKIEKHPDLMAEKEEKLEQERQHQKKLAKEREKQAKREIEEKKRQAELRSYDRVFKKPSNTTSNQQFDGDVDVNEAEEDFM